MDKYKNVLLLVFSHIKDLNSVEKAGIEMGGQIFKYNICEKK